jgi:hypothetical protein
MADVLEVLRAEMANVEQEIKTHEDALGDLRRRRTALGSALRGLDPQWAAKRKPKTSKASRRSDGSYAISDEKVEAVLTYVREHHADGTFTAGELPLSELRMSFATRSQALVRLQERGNIRLDNVKGRMKFYALTE